MSARAVVLMLSVAFLVASSAACERGTPQAPQATQPVRETPPPPSTEATRHGSGLPFEPGRMPKIEDVEVQDLSKFLVAHAWCTNAPTEAQFTFSKDGRYQFTRGAGGEVLEEGQWSIEGGRVKLSPDADGTPRLVDVQAGKVNDRLVISMDGKLHAACEAAAPK